MIRKTATLFALVLSLVLVAPVAAQGAPPEPAPEPSATISGIVVSVEVTTVFALPRGHQGNGRKYAVISVVTDAGSVKRVVIPFDSLMRGIRSAPNPGDDFGANPEIEELHGFATPQYVAHQFFVVPQ